MHYQFNNPVLKERRRELRQNMTEGEKLLWQKLKGKQTGHRFLRQYSLGYFVLDFYCPRNKLAIELDGSHHGEKEQQEYDSIRNEFILSFEIKTLRFPNSEVISNLDGVLKTITDHL